MLASVAAAGGAFDGILLYLSKLSTGKTILSVVFMTLFLYVGLQIVTSIRFRYRPDASDEDSSNSSAPPRAGGWANPTRGQMATDRFQRIWKSMWGK